MIHRMYIAAILGALLTLPASAQTAPLAKAATDARTRLGMAAWGKGDYAAALSPLTAAADAGDAFAQYVLAGMYRWGRGVEEDDARAVALYRRAAESGETVPLASAGTTIGGQAMYELGMIYGLGRGSVGRDPAEALKWFERWSRLVDPSRQDQVQYAAQMVAWAKAIL